MTLARTYACPGQPDVMLVLLHAGTQTTAWTLHRPETCYAANGFAVGGAHDTSWPIARGLAVPGRMMTMTRAKRVEQVGYWRRVGQGFPSTRAASRRL